MYRYLNICGDAKFATRLPVSRIRETLDCCLDVVLGAEGGYVNAPGRPWLLISIINCDSAGNYPAGLPQTGMTANLVELVLADGTGAENEAFYFGLAAEIAEQLGRLILEDR